MATLAQLESEPYWDREVVTVELAGLGVELRRRTGRPADAFGAKGNIAHLRGGHRSQEWILHSAFCTSRTYTVQSGLTAEQARYIAAFDWTPGEWGTAANRALMVEVTRRELAALRAGQLVGVTEVIGTLDGKTVHGERANGTTFSADDSHLDHLHNTFDRRRMHDAALMARIADLITGDDMALRDDPDGKALIARVNALIDMADNPTGDSLKPETNELAKTLRAIGQAQVALNDKLEGLLTTVEDLAEKVGQTQPTGTVTVTGELTLGPTPA